STFEDDDVGGLGEVLQLVCDEETQLAVEGGLEAGFEEVAADVHVNSRQRIIQQINVRIRIVCAREGDARLLAAGEGDALLANERNQIALTAGEAHVSQRGGRRVLAPGKRGLV